VGHSCIWGDKKRENNTLRQTMVEVLRCEEKWSVSFAHHRAHTSLSTHPSWLVSTRCGGEKWRQHKWLIETKSWNCWKMTEFRKHERMYVVVVRGRKKQWDCDKSPAAVSSRWWLGVNELKCSRMDAVSSYGELFTIINSKHRIFIPTVKLS